LGKKGMACLVLPSSSFAQVGEKKEGGGKRARRRGFKGGGKRGDYFGGGFFFPFFLRWVARVGVGWRSEVV